MSTYGIYCVKDMPLCGRIHTVKISKIFLIGTCSASHMIVFVGRNRQTKNTRGNKISLSLSKNVYLKNKKKLKSKIHIITLLKIK